MLSWTRNLHTCKTWHVSLGPQPVPCPASHQLLCPCLRKHPPLTASVLAVMRIPLLEMGS